MRGKRQNEDQFAIADKPQTKESCASHASFRIVEEAVDAGVSELRWDLLDEEEVGVEPA